MYGSVFFEEYELGITRRTVPRTVTETDVVLHASHIGGDYPCWAGINGNSHKLDESAKLVQDTLVFALTIGLTAASHPINAVAFTYGYDNLRFLGKLQIGETVWVQVTIASKSDDPKRQDFGRVIERCETFNQDGNLILSCDHILMVQKSESASSIR